MQSQGSSRLSHTLRTLLFLALMIVMLTPALAQTSYAVDVTAVSEDQEADAQDPLTIALPFRERSEAGLEENLFTVLSGKYYYLALDGEVLVAAPTEDELLALVSDAVDPYITDASVSCALTQSGELELCYGYVAADANFDLTEGAKRLADVLEISTVERSTQYVTIPAGEQHIDDPDRYVEEGNIIITGKDGLREDVLHTTFVNGAAQSTVVVDTTVVEAAVDKLIYVPTKTHEYIWPAQGTVTSHFGRRSVAIGSSNHKGMDIAVPYGSEIVAAKGGTVIYSGYNRSGYGYAVKIDHGDGSVTVYAHNSSLLVSVGDVVEQGEAIALAGSTGTSSGVHCHFEIQLDGVRVDPEPYLTEE